MSETLSASEIDAIARRIADLAGGGGTSRCISLDEGVLSPDLRVNYEFGMVLGVDEFRQEQRYFLEKEYLHNRALHGYGTVYGLQVTLGRPSADPNDVQIAVEPGMAIDQWGRAVMVRERQCAHLGAWLQRNPAPDVGPSAEQQVYVVIRYDECPDNLQPIAGQPCAGSDAQQAPARIRDSFAIELRWADDLPPVPAWRAVRRFARLMAAVQVEPGLAAGSSDEALIIAQVLGLGADGEGLFDEGGAGVSGLPLDPPRDTLLLPVEGLREALDRIFVVWATRVRPTLRPLLSDPAAESEGDQRSAFVPLAAIGFTPDAPYIPDDLLDEAVDNSVRPVLLHTQLIQELLLLGGRAAPPREFAVLRAYGTRVIHMWLNYPAPVEIPREALAVERDGRRVAVDEVRRLDASLNLFEVVLVAEERRPVFTPIGEIGDIGLLRSLPAPRSRLMITFSIDRLQARGGGGLFAPEGRLGAGYIGYDRRSDTIAVRAIVEPSQEEFASLQPRGGGSLHVWINFPAELAVPPIEALRLFSEGQPLEVIDTRRLSGALNHFEVTAGRGAEDVEDPGGRTGIIDPGAQVELRVNLAGLRLTDGTNKGTPLLPILDRRAIAYHNRDGDTVTVRTIADRLPAVRELVTVSSEVFSEGMPLLTLWFHPNTEGRVSLFEGEGAELALAIHNADNDEAMDFSLTPLDPVERNGRTYAAVWQVFPSGETPFSNGSRLVLTFLTQRMYTLSDELSLAELIEQQRLAFVGFMGNDRVRVYHQVRLPEEQGEIDIREVVRIVREQLLRRPSLPFVTITAGRPSGQNPTERPFELWFHLDRFAVQPPTTLLGYSFDGRSFIAQLDVRIFAELGGPQGLTSPDNFPPVPLPPPSPQPALMRLQPLGPPLMMAYNRCVIGLNNDQLNELDNPPLRFVFNTSRFLLGDPADPTRRIPLSQLLNQTGDELPISFLGDNGQGQIIAFVRLVSENF
jgi:hypothetical protein